MRPSTRSFSCLALFAFCVLAASELRAQPAATPSRGELLYNTHCIECHTTQMHWRDQRRARDWESLKYWVARWQATADLRWSDEDIEAVARHLNDTIYHYPRSVVRR